jgi:hypothetical protein
MERVIKGLMKIKYKAELDKCLSDLLTCQNLINAGFQVILREPIIQVTTPNNQIENSIILTLEYTIS